MLLLIHHHFWQVGVLAIHRLRNHSLSAAPTHIINADEQTASINYKENDDDDDDVVDDLFMFYSILGQWLELAKFGMIMAQQVADGLIDSTTRERHIEIGFMHFDELHKHGGSLFWFALRMDPPVRLYMAEYSTHVQPFRSRNIRDQHIIQARTTARYQPNKLTPFTGL